MNVSRRQAIFGSIAAAFTGPGLVASVEAAELRKKMEPLLKWLNEHQHCVTSVGAPTAPASYVAGKAKSVGTFEVMKGPRFLIEKNPNLVGWKIEKIVDKDGKLLS